MKHDKLPMWEYAEGHNTVQSGRLHLVIYNEEEKELGTVTANSEEEMNVFIEWLDAEGSGECPICDGWERYHLCRKAPSFRSGDIRHGFFALEMF